MDSQEITVTSAEAPPEVEDEDEAAALLLPRPKHALDAFSDAEVIKAVEDLKNETKHIQLENMVFERFLQKNDLALITGMAQIVDMAIKLQEDAASDEGTSRKRRLSSFATFTASTITSLNEKGPKINISQKTDLAMRETEQIQIALNDFVKKSHRAKCNLKAELEEFSIRGSELLESRTWFENSVVIGGVDKLTQRIPAEKFLRYMEEWLRSAEVTLEKLRLRTSSLYVQFQKVSSQLLAKEELGQTLHAVDFEQLKIENQRLIKKIEEKNTHLLELKKMNGKANLALTAQKQYLQKQIQELNGLKDSVKSTERKISACDDEGEAVEKELVKAQEHYEKLKDIKDNYRVPSVIDYIRKKAELYDLKKSVKICTRRNKIQEDALRTCTRQMKSITRQPHARDSWYKMPITTVTNDNATNVNFCTTEDRKTSLNSVQTNESAKEEECF